MNNQENYTYNPPMPSVENQNNNQTTIAGQNVTGQNMPQYPNNGVPQYQGQEMQNNYPIYNPEHIPEEIKGLNWGAFFWNWVWLIPINVTYAIIMFFANMFTGGTSTIVLAFYLLFQGNELAWKNKQYRSIEEFQEEQKKWTLSGLVCVLLPAVLAIIGIAILFTMYCGMIMSLINK